MHGKALGALKSVKASRIKSRNVTPKLRWKQDAEQTNLQAPLSGVSLRQAMLGPSADKLRRKNKPVAKAKPRVKQNTIPKYAYEPVARAPSKAKQNVVANNVPQIAVRRYNSGKMPIRMWKTNGHTSISQSPSAMLRIREVSSPTGASPEERASPRRMRGPGVAGAGSVHVRNIVALKSDRFEVNPSRRRMRFFRGKPGRIRVRTNRRGLVNWRNWKGELWNPDDTPLYRHSRYCYRVMRTHKQLRSLRRDGSLRPFPVRQFWKAYYSSTRRIDDELKPLQLHQVDLNLINFLLRTAPTSFARRMSKSHQAFDVLSYQLQAHIDELRTIRLIMYRTQSPLNFEVASKKHALSSFTTATDRRTADKIYRVQRKAATGSLNLGMLDSSHARRLLGDESKTVASTLDLLPKIYNANSALWAIEPLSIRLTLSLGTLRNLSRDLDIYARRRPDLDKLFGRDVERAGVSRRELQEILDKDKEKLWELIELRDELTALRYHRLKLFPGSFTSGEVELGTALWNHTQWRQSRKLGAARSKSSAFFPAPASLIVSTTTTEEFVVGRSPDSQTEDDGARFANLSANTDNEIPENEAVSPVVLANSYGLVNWDRWKGQDWKVEELNIFRDIKSVRDAADAYHRYQTFRARIPQTPPLMVETFLKRHHLADYMAIERLNKFALMQANMQVIIFLLRTAPSHVGSRLMESVEKANSLLWELNDAVEVLRPLQVILAHSPHNPLLFKSGVEHFKADQESATLRDQLRHELMLRRQQHKAEVRRKGFGVRQYEHKANDTVENLFAGIAMSRSRSMTWWFQHPFIVAEPFSASVSMVVKRIRGVLKFIKDMKNAIIAVLSAAAWHAQQQTIDSTYANGLQILSLTHDLTALRYYRIYHFPDSLSQEEQIRNKALEAMLQPSRRHRASEARSYHTRGVTEASYKLRKHASQDADLHTPSGRRNASVIRPRRGFDKLSKAQLEISQLAHRLDRTRDKIAQRTKGVNTVLYEPAVSERQRDRQHLRLGGPSTALQTHGDEELSEEESLARWLKMGEEGQEDEGW